MIGPGKYTANAENPDKQFCYFNKKTNIKSCYTFISKRIRSSQFEISFQIGSLIDITNNGQVKVFEAVSELKDLVEKNRKRQQFQEKTD